MHCKREEKAKRLNVGEQQLVNNLFSYIFIVDVADYK